MQQNHIFKTIKEHEEDAIMQCLMCSRLLNHTKKVVFTVRMIHSEPLLMSAVHVFFGEKMSAVAHLVVGDQLPLPEMVHCYYVVLLKYVCLEWLIWSSSTVLSLF